jgi:hypothetical protein
VFADSTKSSIDTPSGAPQKIVEHSPVIQEEVKSVDFSSSARTKLKPQSPAFQPLPKDTRLDNITQAIYLALVSCGQTQNVKLEQGVKGAATVISAELRSGTQSSSRCYDTVRLAKQALEEITSRLPTTSVLSGRVQKEQHGYSLRSSLAIIPHGAEDYMCWDVIRRGCCPRRGQCTWYHPQDADINKVKVSVKYIEDTEETSGPREQISASLPAQRHKISLGELVQ